jgi:lysophospholipid acyltransferase (LPLAT)-like uncharacterized protein
LKQIAIGFVAWLVYRLLSLTWRVTVHEPEPMRTALQQRRALLLAHWHGDEFALLQLMRRYRAATLASPSKDGRIMATMLRLQGGVVSVGSSSKRGAIGLKQLIRLARDGYACSLAVDGPRGPIYKVKPGMLQISRLLECPIYYPSISCDRAFHMHRSWDRGYVPKPFARVHIEWRGPVAALDAADDPRDPLVIGRLEQLMLQAKRDAKVPGQQAVPDALPQPAAEPLPEQIAL